MGKIFDETLPALVLRGPSHHDHSFQFAFSHKKENNKISQQLHHTQLTTTTKSKLQSWLVSNRLLLYCTTAIVKKEERRFFFCVETSLPRLFVSMLGPRMSFSVGRKQEESLLMTFACFGEATLGDIATKRPEVSSVSLSIIFNSHHLFSFFFFSSNRRHWRIRRYRPWNDLLVRRCLAK